MIKKLILLLGFTLCFIVAKAQQDALYGQYVFNGLYINPAYAGYKGDFNINAFYSSQWTGIDGAPQTQSIAGDGQLNNGRVGLGFMVQSDEIGAQSNIAAYANYSYRIRLGYNENSKLAFGLGFGFIQSGIDGSKLNAVQANDTYIPTGNVSLVLPDARVGILYTNENFFAGASVDNLLAQYVHTSNPNALFIQIPKPNEYYYAGALFAINDETKFKPSVLIKDSPDFPTSIDFNAFILLGNKIWFGATYRAGVTIYNKPNLSGVQNSNAMVATTEFSVSETFKIGYAFDYSVSKIGNYGYGSHELSLSIVFKKSKASNSDNQSYF
jgi:type IX secretion system PorP/SprF family membrane protein